MKRLLLVAQMLTNVVLITRSAEADVVIPKASSIVLIQTSGTSPKRCSGIVIEKHTILAPLSCIFYADTAGTLVIDSEGRTYQVMSSRYAPPEYYGGPDKFGEENGVSFHRRSFDLAALRVNRVIHSNIARLSTASEPQQTNYKVVSTYWHGKLKTTTVPATLKGTIPLLAQRWVGPLLYDYETFDVARAGFVLDYRYASYPLPGSAVVDKDDQVVGMNLGNYSVEASRFDIAVISLGNLKAFIERDLLPAANFSIKLETAWRNPFDRLDVNADGAVNTADINLLRDFLAAAASAPGYPGFIPTNRAQSLGLYPDVNADGKVSAQDLTSWMQGALPLLNGATP